MEDAAALKSRPLIQESEKILSEMNRELSSLRDRVKSLEVESQDSRMLMTQLKTSRQMNDQLIVKVDQELGDAKDNYHVMAGMMKELKVPIQKVVGNLTEWGESIGNEDIKKSFEECVRTAERALSSFNKAEDFCNSIVSNIEEKAKKTDLREFLKNMISKSYSDVSKFKVFIDKSLPSAPLICSDALHSSLGMVLDRLMTPENHDKQVMISLLRNEERGLDEGNITLSVKVVSDKKTEMNWGGNWRESVDLDGGNKDMVPLEWLKCKNYLKSLNGNLVIISKDGKVIGTEIHLPAS